MTFKLHLKEAWNFPDGVKREATTWGKTWRCKRKWQFSGIERSHQLRLLIRGVPLDGWDVPLLPVILHSASLVICVLCTVPRGTWTFGFFGSQNQSYIPELGRRIRQAGPHHAVITNSPKMSVNTASLSLHRPLAHCRLIGGGGALLIRVTQRPRLTKLYRLVCPPDTEAGKGNVVNWALIQNWLWNNMCYFHHIPWVKQSAVTTRCPRGQERTILPRAWKKEESPRIREPPPRRL